MNFSIGKLINGIKGGIGALTSGQIPIIDIYQREHSIPYAKNVSVQVNSNTQFVYPIPDMDYFRDKIIVGISTRKQNAGDTRLSKDGHKLLTDAQIARCFLDLSQNNNTVTEKYPAENMVHEPSAGAGTYAQILIERDFTTHSSNVLFSGTASLGLGASEIRALELIFYYVPLSQACYQ